MNSTNLLIVSKNDFPLLWEKICADHVKLKINNWDIINWSKLDEDDNKEFQRQLALNQIYASVFLAFGAAIFTIGAGLVLFAATISLELLEKTGESITLFELIYTEFGSRGWIFMVAGVILMLLGYLHFIKKIENLKWIDSKRSYLITTPRLQYE